MVKIIINLFIISKNKILCFFKKHTYDRGYLTHYKERNNCVVQDEVRTCLRCGYKDTRVVITKRST